MFETLHYNKSLDEELFDEWLESGRNQKIGYKYLMVMWSVMEEEYFCVYVESRSDFGEHLGNTGQEELVAVYDLYSESRISLD